MNELFLSEPMNEKDAIEYLQSHGIEIVYRPMALIPHPYERIELNVFDAAIKIKRMMMHSPKD